MTPPGYSRSYREDSITADQGFLGSFELLADHPLYKRFRPWAERVKISAQMLVGIGIFLALIYKLLIPTFSEPGWIALLLADEAPLAIVG